MLARKSFSFFITLFILVVSFSSCKAQTIATTPTLNWKEYEIDSDIADAMMEYFDECNGQECKDHEILNRKKSRRESIEAGLKAEGLDVINVKFLKARYRAEDVERYKRLNNTTESVLGVATEIVEVKVRRRNNPVNQSNLESAFAFFRYFDSSTVCPPPANCN